MNYATLREELDIDQTALGRLQKDAQSVNTISLNKKWYETDSDNDVTGLDILADTKANLPTKREGDLDRLRDLTRGLNTNERLIIILYYYQEETMKKIGATLDLSESRVSQMHTEIMERLQNEASRKRLVG